MPAIDWLSAARIPTTSGGFSDGRPRSAGAARATTQTVPSSSFSPHSRLSPPHSRPIRPIGAGSRREKRVPDFDRSHTVRRSRFVRRALAGADPIGRLGLPDRRGGPGSGSPPPARAARCAELPGAGSRSHSHGTAEEAQAMNQGRFGAADDRALGSSLRVVVTREADLASAKAAVDEILKAVDLAASRFRDDSELSRLNAMPGRKTAVSPLLAKLLGAALRGARITGGAVDPTIGTALKMAGYETDFAQVPTDGSAITLTVSRVPGWQAIYFDEASRTVLIPSGVEIDLGATAKALASDLAATAAWKAIGAGGVLVSLGGDIAVAGDPPPKGWPIQTSEDSGAPIRAAAETISLRSGGIATSST